MQLNTHVIITAAAVLLTGPAGAQDLVVRIGHVAPLSGAQAHNGKDVENGARMAIDDLNARDVLIHGKKARFELVAEDDAALEQRRRSSAMGEPARAECAAPGGPDGDLRTDRVHHRTCRGESGTGWPGRRPHGVRD